MATAKDPTQALKKAAAELPDAVEATSCNQASFKAGKKAFLFVGPGAKGVGFKAMFKLDASLEEARGLAKKEPDRFAAGAGNWVTVRFSAAEPLPKKLWGPWLKESYAGATGGGSAARSSRAKQAPAKAPRRGKR